MQAIITLFTTLITTLCEKVGQKLTLASIAIGGLFGVAYYGKLDGLYAGIGIVIVAVAFNFSRLEETKIKQGVTPTEVK